MPAHFNRRQLTGAAANHPGPISLRDLEMQAIYQALERNGGNKPKAADELGISLKTLYNKLNQASDWKSRRSACLSRLRSGLSLGHDCTVAYSLQRALTAQFATACPTYNRLAHRPTASGAAACATAL